MEARLQKSRTRFPQNHLADHNLKQHQIPLYQLYTLLASIAGSTIVSFLDLCSSVVQYTYPPFPHRLSCRHSAIDWPWPPNTPPLCCGQSSCPHQGRASHSSCRFSPWSGSISRPHCGPSCCNNAGKSRAKHRVDRKLSRLVCAHGRLGWPYDRMLPPC